MRGETRLRTAWYRWRFRKTTRFGAGVQIAGRLEVSGDGTLIVEDGTVFQGMGESHDKIWVQAPATVTLGENCFINGVEIFANEDVIVGRDSIIGGCWISTSPFHAVDPCRRRDPAAILTAPVTIGANVWMANRTAVMPGSSIGANSVVGYGTVVRGNIEPDVVVSDRQMRVVKGVRGS